jgi:hypothetical protein
MMMGAYAIPLCPALFFIALASVYMNKDVPVVVSIRFSISSVRRFRLRRSMM